MKVWTKQKVIECIMLIGIARVANSFIAVLFNSIQGTGYPLSELLFHWDSGWYQRILEQGYTLSSALDGQASYAFFPLYPMLTHLVSDVFHTPPAITGMILSNVFLFVGAIFFISYIQALYPEEDTQFPLILLITGAYSFYYTTLYTEALFFMLSTIFFYLLKQKKYLEAGICSALASATRSVGVFLVFSLLCNMYLSKYVSLRWKNIKAFCMELLRSPSKLVGIMLCPLGIFTYMYYLYIKFGDAWAYKNVQIGWSREMLFSPLRQLFQNIVNGIRGKDGFLWQYLACAACMILLIYVVLIKEKLYGEAIFAYVNLLIPLFTSVGSVPRYAMGNMFVILGVVLLTRKRWRVYRVGIAACSFVINLILTYLWYGGYVAVI